jgi:hypothetical protein
MVCKTELCLRVVFSNSAICITSVRDDARNRLFGNEPVSRFSRVPILKTRGSILRTYLTIPWVPPPRYADLVNSIDK